MLGLVVEGPSAVTGLDIGDLLAAAHLAVVVTALAFVLWYTAVSRIGAERAGLFTGAAPVAAGVGGVLLGGPMPGRAVWAGILLVAAGLALGLRPRRSGRPRSTRSRESLRGGVRKSHLGTRSTSRVGWFARQSVGTRGFASGGSRATASRLARTSVHVRADGCADSR